MNALAVWVEGLTGTPWVFVALWAMAVIDGFFPPIPSETVVIALASLSASTGSPQLWIVAVVAALGAFSGDQVAYSIGKRVDLRRRRLVRGKRAQEAMAWAEHALHERGAVFIIAARYIPVGRVAVNMTAGGVHYPRARFSALAALAGVSWATYTVLLGVGSGKLFPDAPWLGVTVGVVGGLLLGMVADPVLTRLGRKMGWMALQAGPTPAEDAGTAGPGRSAADVAAPDDRATDDRAPDGRATSDRVPDDRVPDDRVPDDRVPRPAADDVLG